MPYRNVDKPAIVIELKYNQSAVGAIKQIKEKQYFEALKGYVGEIVLVGIDYDKRSKQHECLIERLTKNAPQNAPQKLTIRQQKILDFVGKNAEMSKKQIASALNLSFDILKRELSAMSGIVKYVGPSKGGHWEVTTDR